MGMEGFLGQVFGKSKSTKARKIAKSVENRIKNNL